MAPSAGPNITPSSHFGLGVQEVGELVGFKGSEDPEGCRDQRQLGRSVSVFHKLDHRATSLSATALNRHLGAPLCRTTTGRVPSPTRAFSTTGRAEDNGKAARECRICG